MSFFDSEIVREELEIINELQEYKFRAICPLDNSSKIKDHYSEKIDWKISKTKFFDINAIFRLKRILDNLGLTYTHADLSTLHTNQD